MRRARTLARLLVVIIGWWLMGAMFSLAAPPEGKGPDKEKEPNGRAVGQQQTPPGQEQRAEAEAARTERAAERAAEVRTDRAAERTEVRTDRAEHKAERAESRADRAASANAQAEAAKTERQHPHLERRSLERVDRASATAAEKRTAAETARERDRRPEHARGRDTAHERVARLVESLNKIEHARWSYHPHDTRGQGNMGKVDMRDPYGFDKESGREGSERGRPIQKTETAAEATEAEIAVPDLASLVSVDFFAVDPYLAILQSYLTFWQNVAGYAWLVTYYQNIIASYTPLPYDPIRVNQSDTINYTLSFQDVPEVFEGKTLEVTTSLISLSDYNTTVSYYDQTTYRWVNKVVDYDPGEVVVQQTQEMTLTDGGSFTYTYDPPQDLTNYVGTYFELAVTVTEPESGATYTMTYDRQLYLYRCPYGIVYDKTTGKPIVGATVTIHNADGSIALLDKAANPNVSNPQTTDATGRYNAKLAIGKKYYLTVKTPGYAAYQSPLFSERWHIVREDVGLTPVTQTSEVSSPDVRLPASFGANEQAPTTLAPGLGLGAPLPAGK